MAGGGEAEDNPVNINVVPMVDVIFCLCVFFMCSFKFKELEGKFQSWLPKDKGNGAASPDEIKEIRIAMYWDEQTQKTKRLFVSRFVENDEEMKTLIDGAHRDWEKLGKPDIPVILDAEAKVPWAEIMKMVNICKQLNIDKIEFALGAGAPTTN
jgi:biopolymer transport protein ExbD